MHQQYTKHLFICKRERKGHACTSSQPLELTQSQHSLYWVNTRPTPHPFPNNPQSSVLALALVNTPPPPFPKQPSELTQSQHDLVNPPHPPPPTPQENSPQSSVPAFDLVTPPPPPPPHPNMVNTPPAHPKTALRAQSRAFMLLNVHGGDWDGLLGTWTREWKARPRKPPEKDRRDRRPPPEQWKC